MIAGFDWRWDILNENIPVDDFVCERNDHHFEHFIKDSAILYQKERLAVTYVILLVIKLLLITHLQTTKSL